MKKKSNFYLLNIGFISLLFTSFVMMSGCEQSSKSCNCENNVVPESQYVMQGTWGCSSIGMGCVFRGDGVFYLWDFPGYPDSSTFPITCTANSVSFSGTLEFEVAEGEFAITTTEPVYSDVDAAIAALGTNPVTCIPEGLFTPSKEQVIFVLHISI